MVIKDLETLKETLSQIKTPVFGVGVYAFNRIGLEEIIPGYKILALRYSLDTKLIEKDIKVISLERKMGTKHIREPRNATTVMRHPRIQKYLEKFNQPALLVYKPSKKIEETCQENNWQLIANPSSFGKDLFENKINFREILKEIGITPIPGKITSLDKLHYGHLINTYGVPFVIQHPTKGGGKGTFFINSQEDFDKAVKKLEQKWDEENEREVLPPTQVIVAQFIQGPSPSMTGCVTKDGILSTNLQHQILDMPQLYNPEKGSGLFCGHDWTVARFSDDVLDQAYQAVEKIGQYFKQKGYHGIFGLDFVLDQKSNQLYLTECNPRLLGSYPTLNMVQLINKETPILAFHILDFLKEKIDYQIDVEKINNLMRQEKNGSQMLLHNLTGRWTKNHQQVKAGIYKIKNNKLKYLRPGYSLKHLRDKEEFLLADGVPFKKSHFSPNRRICRILTLNQTLAETDYKHLTPWAQKVAEITYDSFKIKPVHFIKIKKFFFPNFLAKG